MTVATAGPTMVFCGLNINQSHGFDELHFGIFVSLALLVIYQDWLIMQEHLSAMRSVICDPRVTGYRVDATV
jgi:hypothetical protein